MNTILEIKKTKHTRHFGQPRQPLERALLHVAVDRDVGGGGDGQAGLLGDRRRRGERVRGLRGQAQEAAPVAAASDGEAAGVTRSRTPGGEVETLHQPALLLPVFLSGS